ncbi:hypothetical protein M8C21_032751 [Ambrosia artemisiifolia]|uniref:Uncharacterized protein n=1 Tax=Ambrosia artemisiifolia TaxID=4212 RepID=A0AAD5D9M6_AMBAR|nr:hypothetical protein M8C21_032751 [Ambrosia artemisiifolia]
MGFWTLFEVASMPTVQVIIVSVIGAIMATDRFDLLSNDIRRGLNKVVYASKYWHNILMWRNIGVDSSKAYQTRGTYGRLDYSNVFNRELGKHSSANHSCNLYSKWQPVRRSQYILKWVEQLIRNSAVKYNAMKEAKDLLKVPNKDLDSDEKSQLLNKDGDSCSTKVDPENPTLVYQQLASKEAKKGASSSKLIETLHRLLEELLAPPTVGAIIGFIFGAVPWLKNLVIGDDAPLRVIQDSITLLGDGTLPCITLILGGNLVQGLRNASIRPIVIITIIIVRYVFLPMIGIGVIKAAEALGLLPYDPLFKFVLLIQFTVPPAMNISTMTQLFNVGQEECSVLTMWTYIVAAFALTGWSTVFMSILT